MDLRKCCIEAFIGIDKGVGGKGLKCNSPFLFCRDFHELNVSNLNWTVDFWGWFLEEMNYEPFQGKREELEIG